MKKILLAFLLFLTYAASGQTVVDRSSSPSIIARDQRAWFKLTLRAPVFADTTAANTAIGKDSLGLLIVVPSIHKVYFRDTIPGDHKWTEFALNTPGTVNWADLGGSPSDNSDLMTLFDAKQDQIATGTASQYFRGDLSLATFPTDNTAFTNGAGYLTSALGKNSITGTGITGDEFELDGDVASPGARKFYRTSSGGTKQWGSLDSNDIPGIHTEDYFITKYAPIGAAKIDGTIGNLTYYAATGKLYTAPIKNDTTNSRLEFQNQIYFPSGLGLPRDFISAIDNTKLAGYQFYGTSTYSFNPVQVQATVSERLFNNLGNTFSGGPTAGHGNGSVGASYAASQDSADAYSAYSIGSGVFLSGVTTKFGKQEYVIGKAGGYGNFYGGKEFIGIDDSGQVRLPKIKSRTIDTSNLKMTVVDADGNFFKMSYPTAAGGTTDTSHLRDDIDSLKSHAVTGLFGDVASAGPGSSAAIVNGIKSKTVPTLSVGVLKYNGTSWEFDNSADDFADSVRRGLILDTIPATHAGSGIYNFYVNTDGTLVDKTQIDGYGIVSANQADSSVKKSVDTAGTHSPASKDYVNARVGSNIQIAESQVTGLTTDLAAKAPLASPTFTGTPSLPTGTTAVTQSPGNNSTKVSTTAYVDAAVAAGGGGSGGGWIDSLTSGTVTSQSSEAINLTSWYNKYREIVIDIYDYKPSADNSSLYLNTSADGSTYDNSSGDYRWNYHSGYSTSDVTSGTGASSALVRRVGSDTKISLGSAIGNASSGNNYWQIRIFSASVSNVHNVKFSCSYMNNSSEPIELDGIGSRMDAGVIKGIELSPDSGTTSFYYTVTGKGRL